MDSGSFLKLIGCRQHNLKEISLTLPKNSLVVFTGVSGSGKSSLAFDTLHAEGQRRYIEALSPSSRSLLRQLPRPDVDRIDGLSPTLALSQGHGRISSRATVATHTDIQDFLALLYARIGEQYSPLTGRLLTRTTRQEIVEKLLREKGDGVRLQIIAPMVLGKESVAAAVMRLQTLGYVRLRLNGVEFHPEDTLPPGSQLEAVIDRLVMREGLRERLSDSLATALELGGGVVRVIEGAEGPVENFSELYVCPDTGERFAPLRPAEFNYLSPQGACPTCRGQGGACLECRGQRLKAASRLCRIRGQSLPALLSLSVTELRRCLHSWEFVDNAALVAAEVIPQIESRLALLEKVGLGYLELNRPGDTLSEGENQRVQLAAQTGTKLSGVLYVLDEPTHGLHPSEVDQLIAVLRELRDLGNSVIVVEHDARVMRAADQLIEIGPGAGIHGGSLMFQGSYEEMLERSVVTGPWLTGRKKLAKRKPRTEKKEHLVLRDLSLHNLKNISVDIPLHCLVALCGVSGSGKSTLAIDLIAVQHERSLIVDQRIPGTTKRSTPATYVGLMNPLRQLYADTRLAQARGYSAAHFSLNKRGGRCEGCEGQGQVTVELPMLSDLTVTCEVCQGRRYNYETLQILFKDVSIADALELSAEQALDVFSAVPKLRSRLELMVEMGLGYLTLGQPFPTLSGGELQRLKLVADLALPRQESTLYILDEPSSGLHFEDVEKLARILDRLVDEGHSVLLVEHNMALISQADWVIEMGPGGGPHGGRVIFEGVPAQLAKADTPTGRALA